MTTPLLVRPDELDQLELELGRSAVIEASAGTGKTYLLEHLVLELLITGRARLEEILVVTFTERATAELVVRIRQKIEQALLASRAVGWTLDDAAHQRLRQARQSFDQATIATIHAFCQRILTDEPLTTRRLLAQTQVDGRQAFGEVFRDVLRRELTTLPEHAAYLTGYLANGRSVADLEDLLYRAAAARGDWANQYDEAELHHLAERLARLDLDAVDLEKTLRKLGMHGNSVGALMKRLRRLVPEAEAALATLGWGRLLACFDACQEMVFPHFETIAGWGELVPPVLVPLRQIAVLALRAAPPLDHAIAQRFLPLVEAKLQERKLAEGLYDYDDMIRGVDAAINGARSVGGADDGSAGSNAAALVDSLRRRYRYALVDEAQDTEPAQWRIFRRVFLESPAPNPVVLIGDPKQAIYGFRGADVQTYVQAREEIRARGGVVLPLERNFRSHPEVVDAYNAILDHTAAPAYFSGEDIGYQHPVTAAKSPLGDGPGVTLFQVEPPSAAADLFAGAAGNGEQAITGSGPGPGGAVQGADRAAPVRIGAIRQALREAIATEVQRLSAPERGVCLSEIFVLTRSNSEAREVSTRLHASGIPNILFKPDDIFGSAEAAHVRALLLAISAPGDRAARLAAWLTPFFDLQLEQLARWVDPPPEHPLLARLLAWKGLADAHAYDQLWARILDDSGVARRLRLSAAGLRRLTNYRHLFDVLHAAAAARPLSVTELAALLAAFAAGRRRGGAGEDETQRLETEADAVRVMTIHAAKGLEADHVFIYGGLTAARFWRGLHALQRDQARWRCAGKPRTKRDVELIDSGRQEEAQRLLYVAMTRARRHLYLPFFPATDAGDLEGQTERGSGDFDPFKKISGEYRHVNQRLRALAATGTGTTLFRVQPLSLAADTPITPAALCDALAAWTPPPAKHGDGGDAGHRPAGNDHDGGDDSNAEYGLDAMDAMDAMDADGDAESSDLELLRVQRRGFALTSYSRLSEAEGGYQPPTARAAGQQAAASDILLADEAPGAVAGLDALERLDIQGAINPGGGAGFHEMEQAETLPGGLASGLFLHAILEKVALGTLPALAAWRSQPEVRRIIEAEARRWEREPRHFDEAARLVHAALTVPLDMPGGVPLAGMARAARIRREVDFLFPLPRPTEPAPAPTSEGSEDRLVHERGFVRGALDVLFEHEGRVCFADWKSNVLPDYGTAAVREHVSMNYALQVQIYTLAVVRMLGITDRADYDRRFGGLVYLFLRGLTPLPAPRHPGRERLPGDGLYIHRPDYSDVERWNRELGSRRVAGEGGAW